jgi:transglutaminase-like putative cysteine protease
MIYRVTHVTRYEYADPVAICYNRAHLIPRSCAHQRRLRSELRVTPTPAVTGQRRTDYHGNEISYFTVQTPHTVMEITAVSDVELTPMLPPDPARTPAWEETRDLVRTRRTRDMLDAYEFTFSSRYIKPFRELAEYARACFPPGRPVLEAAVDLMRRIHAEFAYDPGATHVATPLEEVLQNRRGVCQDFAHLMIGCLRELGLPARYVSGYILPHSDEKDLHLVGAQASHAWLALFVPEAGWIDLDPTNNMIPSTEHITLAWGADYDEVSPLRGVLLGGGQQWLDVDVRVTRVEA